MADFPTYDLAKVAGFTDSLQLAARGVYSTAKASSERRALARFLVENQPSAAANGAVHKFYIALQQ
jgi:hypothetical protein